MSSMGEFSVGSMNHGRSRGITTITDSRKMENNRITTCSNALPHEICNADLISVKAPLHPTWCLARMAKFFAENIANLLCAAIKTDPRRSTDSQSNAEIPAQVLEQLLNKCERHHSADIIGITPTRRQKEKQRGARRSRILSLCLL